MSQRCSWTQESEQQACSHRAVAGTVQSYSIQTFLMNNWGLNPDFNLQSIGFIHYTVEELAVAVCEGISVCSELPDSSPG